MREFLFPTSELFWFRLTGTNRRLVRQRRAMILCLILSTAIIGAQAAQNEKETNATGQATEHAHESLQLATEEVKRIEFAFADDRNKKLSLLPAPVQRYATPHIGEVYTNLFVWTYQGRPEAIASVSNWYSPRAYRGLAVTSLATKKLIGRRDGREIWHPKSAGVEFQMIPDADVPGATAVRRLRQMRQLARDFRAEFKRDANRPEGGKLRLLSTPLYRYESPDRRIIDGAVFAFAFGTSSQLVLLIEAHQTAGGANWQYALAPRNSTEYQVWYKGREVWSLPQLAPPWPNSKDPTNTFSVFPDLQRDGRTEEFVQRLLEFGAVPQSLKTEDD